MVEGSVAALKLADIDEVEPMSGSDVSCIKEVREVLERHGASERFGITLLHEHFRISDHELLLETVDTEQRTQTVRPAPGTVASDPASIATSWRLDAPGELAIPLTWCIKGGHRGP